MKFDLEFEDLKACSKEGCTGRHRKVVKTNSANDTTVGKLCPDDDDGP